MTHSNENQQSPTIIHQSPAGLLAKQQLALSDSNAIALLPKAQIMREVNSQIPMNKDYGSPEYIYRADLIPEDLLSMDSLDRDAYLENAIVELDYTQGFPTMPNAEPFWSKLQCEDAAAYKAFTTFLDMPRPQSGSATPVRQLHMLQAMTGSPMQNLLSYAHMFYWHQRAQCYDNFIVASHAKMKEHRLLAAEAEHYETSTAFIKTAKAKLENLLEDDEADVSAKEVLDIMKFFVQLQRLSLGAMPFSIGLPKDAGAPQNQNLEVIMRTLTQRNGTAEQKSIGNDSENNTRALFENEADLKQAQELVIRISDINNPRTGRQMQSLPDDLDPFGGTG